MAGYNSSIFAYGQTGAGKTHTMQGSLVESEQVRPEFHQHICYPQLSQALHGLHKIQAPQMSPNLQRGLCPRVFEWLFKRIADEESSAVSFILTKWASTQTSIALHCKLEVLT